MTVPDTVKVRCASPQPSLLTGKPCGWAGTRTGREVTGWDGRTYRTPVDRKRCPRCGGPVAVTEGAHL